MFVMIIVNIITLFQEDILFGTYAESNIWSSAVIVKITFHYL